MTSASPHPHRWRAFALLAVTSRDLDLPKASPRDVARAVLDGLQLGEEEIVPDPLSAAIAEGWRGGAVKALERQFAQFVQADRASA